MAVNLQSDSSFWVGQLVLVVIGSLAWVSFFSIVPADYFWLVVLRTGRALLKSEPGQLLDWTACLSARRLNLRGLVWLAVVAVGLYGTLAAVPGSVVRFCITRFLRGGRGVAWR